MSANLTIEPLLNGKELDDEALLSIADEFSACIITNDNYNNHKNRLPVPVDRLIKFEPVDPSYDRAVLRDRKLFKRPQAACKLLPSSGKLFQILYIPLINSFYIFRLVITQIYIYLQNQYILVHLVMQPIRRS